MAQSQNSPAKLPYRKPALTIHGDLLDLTRQSPTKSTRLNSSH